MDFAVLATGPSMTQAAADYCRGKCRVIAVSNAYALAPWADALVSQDKIWWDTYPDAMEFAGRKFSTHRIPGVEQIVPGQIQHGTNSGLLGLEVARLLGAKRILMLGFDLRGSHYFGAHPAPLKNTTDNRYLTMLRQFQQWKPRGAVVLNCTPGSRLKCFPPANLEDVI